MMEEEFLESDIIFDEYPPILNEEMVVEEGPVGVKIFQGKSSSIPVRIPAAANKCPVEEVEPVAAAEVLKDDGGEVEVAVVPPHLIIRRRLNSARKMAFSVCTGNGRTLKGRDLSQVRNMILRMTGFLET